MSAEPINVFDLKAEPPTFDIIEGGIQLRPHNYFINWERLDSYPKLCEWIRHLCEKNWVTRQHISALVMQTEKHFGWEHRYGP